MIPSPESQAETSRRSLNEESPESLQDLFAKASKGPWPVDSAPESLQDFFAKANTGPRPVDSAENTKHIKYSFQVAQDLAAKVQEVCQLRRAKVSAVLREILEENLETYRRRALGKPEADAGRADGDLVIRLNDDTRNALARAAEDWNVSPSALVQMILTEHLPDFIQKGREARARIQQALQEQAETGKEGRARR
jgi:hypothetical protein